MTLRIALVSLGTVARWRKKATNVTNYRDPTLSSMLDSVTQLGIRLDNQRQAIEWQGRRVDALEAQARPPQTEANARVLAGRVDELNAKLADAIARAEAAERELVVAKETMARWTTNYHKRLASDEAGFKAERDAERERAGRLALYAKHQYGCGVDTKGGMFAPGPCTCGLSAALALPASDTKEDDR